MEIKKARNITRNFIKNGETITPFFSETWFFTKGINKVFLKNSEGTVEVDSFSSDKFLSDFIFSDKYDLNNLSLIGSYYFTSVGLISIDEYLLALDICEMYSNRLDENELIIGNCYLNEKGNKFVFLGSFSSEISKYVKYTEKNSEILNIKISKEERKTQVYIYDIRKQSVSLLKKVKLVKDLGKSIVHISSDNLFTKIYRKEIDFYDKYQLSLVLHDNYFFSKKFIGLFWNIKDKLSVDFDMASFALSKEKETSFSILPVNLRRKEINLKKSRSFFDFLF